MTDSARVNPLARRVVVIWYLLVLAAYSPLVVVAATYDEAWFYVNVGVFVPLAAALVTGAMMLIRHLGYEGPARLRVAIWIGGSGGVALGTAFATAAAMLTGLHPGNLLLVVIFGALGGGMGVVVAVIAAEVAGALRSLVRNVD